MKLADAKSLVFELIERHDRDNGVGPDPHQDRPQRHAMAEGKFLSTVSALKRCGLINTAKFEVLAERSLRRLEDLSSALDSGRGFGLGFSYSGAAADVPYTITTAVVTEGLLAAASQSSLGDFDAMSTATRAWMTNDEVLVLTGQGRVPKYSLTDEAVITNVVGFWSSVLGEAHADLASQGRDYVHQSYVKGIGWPYKTGSSRFDLLHACYAARSHLEEPADARAVATAVSRFMMPTGFVDKFDLVEIEEAALAVSRASSARALIEESRGFVFYDEPARVWSLGELLVVAAMLPGGAILEGFWNSVTRRALIQIMAIDFSGVGPRHAMHAAHGLAMTLEGARVRR